MCVYMYVYVWVGVCVDGTEKERESPRARARERALTHLVGGNKNGVSEASIVCEAGGDVTEEEDD